MLDVRISRDRASNHFRDNEENRGGNKIYPGGLEVAYSKSNEHLKRGSGQFDVDTGADVTLIKRKCVRENISVNSEHIIAINGVTPGKCLTLGQIHIDLCRLLCEAPIILDEFPIDTDGLLGWVMLS